MDRSDINQLRDDAWGEMLRLGREIMAHMSSRIWRVTLRHFKALRWQQSGLPELPSQRRHQAVRPALCRRLRRLPAIPVARGRGRHDRGPYKRLYDAQHERPRPAARLCRDEGDGRLYQVPVTGRAVRLARRREVAARGP